jgi:SAM-dependent methyltransferase
VTRELFHAEGLPVLQNRTFPTAAEARESPVGDVVLVQDSRTGLISNAAFNPSLLQYDAAYQNEQACSSFFQRHLDDVAAIIGGHFGGGRLIEVGCGKGYFLEQLRRQGYDITGIDPAYEGGNPDVIRAPFHDGLGLSADGIVLRHVLEHIQDPVAFLSTIADANGGKGSIYIEVPSFDWILAHRTWYDIFYEHVNYFRLADFERMFSRVHQRGELFGGQYLFAVADLASLRLPKAPSDDWISIPSDFLSSIERSIGLIRRNCDRHHAIWGAASKGVIFSLYLQRSAAVVDAMIDINPAKQGRYLACTGFRVSTPDEAQMLLKKDDTLFVMNSNYLNEIVAQTRGQLAYITTDHD